MRYACFIWWWTYSFDCKRAFRWGTFPFLVVSGLFVMRNVTFVVISVLYLQARCSNICVYRALYVLHAVWSCSMRVLYKGYFILRKVLKPHLHHLVAAWYRQPIVSSQVGEIARILICSSNQPSSILHSAGIKYYSILLLSQKSSESQVLFSLL